MREPQGNKNVPQAGEQGSQAVPHPPESGISAAARRLAAKHGTTPEAMQLGIDRGFLRAD